MLVVNLFYSELARELREKEGCFDFNLVSFCTFCLHAKLHGESYCRHVLDSKHVIYKPHRTLVNCHGGAYTLLMKLTNGAEKVYETEVTKMV